VTAGGRFGIAGRLWVLPREEAAMDSREKLTELKRHWKPPVELDRCRPREVHLRPAGVVLAVMSLLFVAGSVAAGALLYVKATADREERRQLMQTGRDAQAEITRKWSTRGDNRRYLMAYRYEVGAGAYDGSVQIGRRAWESVKPGSVLTVRYLPGDPGSHVVLRWEEQLMPLWVPFLVPALLLLVAWLMTLPVSSQRRLLAEGRPAPAIVVSHKKTKDGVVAHYELCALNGTIGSGKMGPKKRQPAPIGSELCVLYEPDRVRHNAAYPLSLVQTRPGAGFRGLEKQSGPARRT
jgi:hypothetical protein